MRPDLIAERQSYQGRDYWVMKDPIALKYFRFEEEEYALLKMIDGARSPGQIKQEFDYQFSPQKISLAELYQLVGLLYRNSLLVSQSPGQGTELLRRSRKRARQQWRQSLTNVLAIRFRGFDPDGFLTWLGHWTGWLFNWRFLVVSLVLWLAAASMLFTHFELFKQKLPAFHDFFAAKNWIWLAIVMALTKVIHEFGHGLACKRFGGECHEMGVMLLVLTPCLYCNVSDSWTLPNKWQRVLIAAAGMYVELLLAAAATFIWWFSQPGFINQLALNTIFVCSVSTLLFNANPLLRYDGYYILSDLLEIPNLRQKATTILQQQLAAWTMGIESRPDPFLPTRRKWLFATYSVAAACYKWLITFSIFWFLYSVLEPYGFKVIGQFLAVITIWGLVGMPLVKGIQFFRTPGRFGMVNRRRLAASLAIAMASLAALMFIPIPHHIRCPYIVESRNGENVYVDKPGTLIRALAQVGEQVTAGQPILMLDDPELELQITQLEGRVAARKAEHDALVRASYQFNNNQNASGDAAVAKAQLESAQADLQQRKKDLQLLTIAAPVTGRLIPPARLQRPNPSTKDLHTWHGYPTDSRNVGCLLQAGTLVGQIVSDQTEFQAVLAVDQSDIQFLEHGQRVALLPGSAPGQTLAARIADVSTTKMLSTPKAVSSRFGGDLVTTRNDEGIDVPQSATFQASARFIDSTGGILIGSTGYAKVRTGSQTVGQRLWRLLQKTFRFDL